MEAFVMNSSAVAASNRLDVSFLQMREQYGAKAKELSDRFSADDVREMLKPIALNDLAILLPLGRGRTRLTRAKVDVMIREYPHLALAAVVDDTANSLRRSHDAIAAAHRYKSVLEDLVHQTEPGLATAPAA